MSEIYGRDYFEHYDVADGSVRYEEYTELKQFMESVADHIVEDLHPATVLDAGCALGFLVAALRDRGVEAYGIDVSEYAISRVREDIRPYCAVGSISDPLPPSLPTSFDLVVSIEVLEHLYEEDGRKAIRNLCSVTDRFLFCSTPDDFSDPTHLNVRQREYWARCFAESGFYADIQYQPGYVTWYAILFRKTEVLRQIEDYERNIRITELDRRAEDERREEAEKEQEARIRDLDDRISALQKDGERLKQSCLDGRAQLEASEDARRKLLARTEELSARIDAYVSYAAERDEELSRQRDAAQRLEEELSRQRDAAQKLEEDSERRAAELGSAQASLAEAKTRYADLLRQKEELSRQLLEAQEAYEVISGAACWKMTKPLRMLLDAWKRIPLFALLCKGLRCWKENGWEYTRRKIADRRAHRKSYLTVAKTPLFTEEELAAQRAERFERQIRFSIVVPLFNTPEEFLQEMIRSVQDQTYGNWELCLADGSDGEHPEVEKICLALSRRDKRIKYKRLEKNLGISGNTNACLDMAAGDYIALFDHDDLLHPAALHEVMAEICGRNADFIYTDEATFESPHTEKIISVHFKPDFAPDNLRANNYICHFTVFKRSLLDLAGRFRPECDGSQDHDMILRLTAHAETIVHIPRILYYWRSHPLSVAKDIGVKTYAIKAGQRAVRDSIEALGRSAVVESSAVFPTIYRIRYELTETPVISVILPWTGDARGLEEYIGELILRSSYAQLEIVAVVQAPAEETERAEWESVGKRQHVQLLFSREKPGSSASVNAAAAAASGKYLAILGNCARVLSEAWMEELLMYAQRPDVGAVGGMVYDGENRILHAGLILGMGREGTVGRAFCRQPKGTIGYMGRLGYSQDLSAVSDECMMVRTDVFRKSGGMDERLKGLCAAADFCLRLRDKGSLIVWTPYAEVGGGDCGEAADEASFSLFRERWGDVIARGDPYYNPNFALDREDFFF